MTDQPETDHPGDGRAAPDARGGAGFRDGIPTEDVAAGPWRVFSQGYAAGYQHGLDAGYERGRAEGDAYLNETVARFLADNPVRAMISDLDALAYRRKAAQRRGPDLSPAQIRRKAAASWGLDPDDPALTPIPETTSHTQGEQVVQVHEATDTATNTDTGTDRATVVSDQDTEVDQVTEVGQVTEVDQVTEVGQVADRSTAPAVTAWCPRPAGETWVDESVDDDEWAWP